MNLDSKFSKVASYIANFTGRPAAFMIAFGVVIAWAVSGPFFDYSDRWQIFINTGTTVVTFLMIFIIQNSQNRDGVAIQAKLDELIRVNSEANNKFIDIEGRATAEEIKELKHTDNEVLNDVEEVKEDVQEVKQDVQEIKSGK